MRWKYRKLINNLSNAIDALCGPDERVGTLSARLRDEAMACLAAAGDRVRVAGGGLGAAGNGVAVGKRGRAVAARVRRCGRAWRGASRSKPTTSTARSCSSAGSTVCPTPINAGLLELVKQAAREGIAPGSLSVDEVIRLVSAGE